MCDINMLVQEVEDDFANGDTQYSETVDLGEVVIEHSAPSGREIIHQELDILREEIHSLKTLAGDASSGIQVCWRE